MTELVVGRFALCHCGHLLPAIAIGPMMVSTSKAAQPPPMEVAFDLDITCPKCGCVHIRKWTAISAGDIVPGKEKVHA
jgi:hypothetical protein